MLYVPKMDVFSLRAALARELYDQGIASGGLSVAAALESTGAILGVTARTVRRILKKRS